jgi:hypothetical protein
LLANARRTLPDRESIPAWLVWAWPLPWLALMVVSGTGLVRATGALT